MKTRFNPFQTSTLAAPAPTPTPAATPVPTKTKRRTKSTAARPARTAARPDRPVPRAGSTAQEALQRALQERSYTNYPHIIEEFHRRGIPIDQIKPRENVFTFKAWKALGRVVKKGEHGVKAITRIPVKTKAAIDPATGEPKPGVYTIPHTATVFHITQTIPLETKEQSQNRPRPDPSSPPAATTVAPADSSPRSSAVPSPCSTAPAASRPARTWLQILRAKTTPATHPTPARPR